MNVDAELMQSGEQCSCVLVIYLQQLHFYHPRWCTVP